MKKFLFILMVLVLIATPVFASEKWSVGVAGGYPQSGVIGQVSFELPGNVEDYYKDNITAELMVGIDYNYGKAVGLGAQLYGTYDFRTTDILILKAGVGVTSRLTGGFYIAPAARIGADFKIPTCAITPFVRGDFGYAFGDAANKFFWEVTGGITYKF